MASAELVTSASERTPLKGGSWISWSAIGPGLLVCLADTDAGCLIVASQSGARWGYSLLPLQVLLIPILFMAQELTIRLGVYTQQGHTACIKAHFGPFWAWSACILLVFECVCAMTSEISGVAVVGELWGLSHTCGTFLAAAIVITVVLCFNYRQIEVVGTALGLFELAFVVTMFALHPDPGEVFRGAHTFHSEPEFMGLVAANIGAVIMPWMIYFQQSAVVARRITPGEGMRQERSHTLVGSILTQLVMIGALVTLAAAGKARNLNSVQDILNAMEPALGAEAAKVAVSLGFLGGSLCAAFVVSLAASWAVCEALGHDNELSMDQPLSKAPHFYGCFLGVVGMGVGVLLSGVDMVRLNVLVELLNGLLLPFAVGFLFLLATGNALPVEARVTGLHKCTIAVVFSCCTALSFGTAVYGIIGHVSA
mmetsp:Transcript_14885/g.52207  ORF Transcript_14885/g.52207 Transcript_14885/m.52207 type:complete len:425 (-) Transcript_14885:315-1589(-)